ncbi:hypothetical protein NQ315_008273 [Exocentrus adspersus]|uniref:DUF4817 domain-containing protein n=1 Tax=Exocentrus adspersus TaxID=1586481 RepID=A0AAV8VNJ3_9CUCU|nr:hypothetical protein NQ315_008273 [Exocentrus adspersus]
MDFTFGEYADMHLMYGLASCNALEARRLYKERFPDRRLPERKTFERVDQRLRETGTVAKAKRNCGNQINRGEVPEEDILNAIEVDPSISVRKLAAQFNFPKTTVFRIFKEQQLYPYHLQKVHALLPDDFLRRMEFANWVLHRHRNNENFIGSVLFTDEAGFSKNGIINSHNLHLWADANPRASLVTHHQHQFEPINVWAGIIGRHLIGPFHSLDNF